MRFPALLSPGTLPLKEERPGGLKAWGVSGRGDHTSLSAIPCPPSPPPCRVLAGWVLFQLWHLLLFCTPFSVPLTLSSVTDFFFYI